MAHKEHFFSQVSPPFDRTVAGTTLGGMHSHIRQAGFNNTHINNGFKRQKLPTSSPSSPDRQQFGPVNVPGVTSFDKDKDSM